MESRDISIKPTVANLIAFLLEEPRIKEKILSKLKPEARNYHKWEFNEQLNRIRFGKYSWGGFGGFWNNLIKCCDHISLDDFYVQVWDTLVEMTAGMPAHEAVLDGLSMEMLKQGIRMKDHDIMQRFMDVLRHLTDDGFWKSPKSDVNERLSRARRRDDTRYADEIEVEVEPRYRKKEPTTLRVVDSVGDVFEVINVRWVAR